MKKNSFIKGLLYVLTMIEQKAANNNTTYEEQLKADAHWIVNSQIDTGEIYWKPTT